MPGFLQKRLQGGNLHRFGRSTPMQAAVDGDLVVRTRIAIFDIALTAQLLDSIVAGQINEQVVKHPASRPRRSVVQGPMRISIRTALAYEGVLIVVQRFDAMKLVSMNQMN